MFGLHSIGFSNGTVLGQVVQSGWIVARRGELWKANKTLGEGEKQF